MATVDAAAHDALVDSFARLARHARAAGDSAVRTGDVPRITRALGVLWSAEMRTASDAAAAMGTTCG